VLSKASAQAFNTPNGESGTRTCRRDVGVEDLCREELPTGFVRFSGATDCITTGTEVRLTLRQNTRCTAEFRTISTATGSYPTFFVTSGRFVPGTGVMSLASADAFCTAAATASTFLPAASKARTWRAFLGSAQGPTGPFIAATERIGAGVRDGANGGPVRRQPERDDGPGDDLNGDGVADARDLERALLVSYATVTDQRGAKPFCNDYQSGLPNDFVTVGHS
jgi:hypothetical protein